MDQFNYIKLIEFHYILEGFTALYKNESDKSSKGIMYRTADQILHEIFQSCVRTVVREETKIKLSRKWREIALERCCLDVSIFNDVHNEITCSLDEFITKKYIEERYTNQWMQNKQREADYAAMVSSSNSINSINSINSTNSATTSSSTSTSTTTTTGINNNNNMGMVCPSLVSLSTVSSSVPINMINGSLGSEASTKVQLIQSNNINSNNNNSNIIPILANGASCYSVPSTTVKPPSRIYQSMLTLDSGFISETSKNAPFSMDGSIVNESEVSGKSSSSKTQRSKSKQEKTRDKFALLPKELLENECSSGGDTVLTRHIKKTFPAAMDMFNEEQVKQSQRNYPHQLRPKTIQPEVSGHLPNSPGHAPTLQVLLDKLENLRSSR
ncbi:uncharacterized protein DDB_G0271670-like [Panonychus citri]|uniref:uncharacterized protein DDB_G0271670-like n=1 Tax=Panonychus citri TaxID=50023 RepID=UPI002307FCAA|nr:uncharacterized protein DDB_G0271670-like [Panonychus citri]